MTPSIQILPPVAAATRDGVATAGAAGFGGRRGALVRAAGWASDAVRAPLFNHLGAPSAPRSSMGFLAQHLVQEWTFDSAPVDPARAAAAYAAPLATTFVGIEMQTTA